jgi:hypothetical protein
MDGCSIAWNGWMILQRRMMIWKLCGSKRSWLYLLPRHLPGCTKKTHENINPDSWRQTGIRAKNLPFMSQENNATPINSMIFLSLRTFRKVICD